MSKRDRRLRACGVLLLWAATAIAASAQTFTVLHNFDNTDGSDPQEVPIQGPDGNLYATTVFGGINGEGSIYKMTPGGTLATIHSFDYSDGFVINGGLLFATDGNFYGTTVIGGSFGQGSVYKVTPTGTLTSLYSFCGSGSPCSDGYEPEAGLMEATNGFVYGTTHFGGSTGFSCGTIFRMAPSGTLTTIHTFQYSDGCGTGAAMIEAPNGNLYGTTVGGGNGYGTIYEATPEGVVTTLYAFDGTHGNLPTQLILANDGNFYGVTVSTTGTGGPGTIFQITPSGTLTTLYNFCTLAGCADGENPYSALLQATDGNFYGTTSAGGTSGDGTVYQFTPSGMLTTLHSFDGTDGVSPTAGLAQATNGIFYGAPDGGGTDNDGTVYSVDMGLGPFVETLLNAGGVGATVRILGTDLAGASSVTFNGVAASFTLVSPTLIRAIVPAGATTGSVQVTTPSGTLTSNVVFRVRL